MSIQRPHQTLDEMAANLVKLISHTLPPGTAFCLVMLNSERISVSSRDDAPPGQLSALLRKAADGLDLKEGAFGWADRVSVEYGGEE